MIDLDVVADTKDGTAFDKALAWLIGIVALTAAVLAAIQVDRSAVEMRAQNQGAVAVSEVTTGMTASFELSRFRLQSTWDGYLGGMAGASRQIAGLEAGSEVDIARGGVEYDVAPRLAAIADAMASLPPEGGPLDPYARSALAATTDELEAHLAHQNAQVELAEIAGRQSNLVIAGLSLIALAAVLAGLSAVLRDGRSGRATLLIGFIATGIAIALGVAALA